MKRLCATINVYLELTEIEEKILLENDNVGRPEALNKIVSECRANPWFAYIWSDDIRTYNCNYNTDYKERQISIQLEGRQGKI